MKYWNRKLRLKYIQLWIYFLRGENIVLAAFELYGKKGFSLSIKKYYKSGQNIHENY